MQQQIRILITSLKTFLKIKVYLLVSDINLISVNLTLDIKNIESKLASAFSNPTFISILISCQRRLKTHWILSKKECVHFRGVTETIYSVYGLKCPLYLYLGPE